MHTRLGNFMAGIVTASLCFLFSERVIVRWLELRESVLNDGPITLRAELMILTNALEDPSIALIAAVAITTFLVFWVQRKNRANPDAG